MATVHYMRAYSEDELADFNARIHEIFKNDPALVEMAVLAVELKCLLKNDDEHVEPAKAVAPPPVIAELIAALEKAIPYLAGNCVLGLKREESFS